MSPLLTRVLICVVASCSLGCVPADRIKEPAPVLGKLTVMNASFHDIVPADARIEAIAQGFTWSEGPEWIKDGGYLLFNDVPENTMYRWSEADGLSVFLKPSGLANPDPKTMGEAGANGLFAEAGGTLLLADSGSRAIARLDLKTKRKTFLAENFKGKRFNSPNDVMANRNGVVFFTDPPYGLKGLNESSIKELAFNGVYAMDPDGRVRLLDDSLSLPNGIALSPDERTLYVANSDPARPVWMAYSLDSDGKVTDKRVFADASDLMGEGVPGLPDGIAISEDGKIFATGPGGVLVMEATGQRLGRIETGDAISNCAFGDDGHTLYMTSHKRLARVRVKAVGLGFEKRK